MRSERSWECNKQCSIEYSPVVAMVSIFNEYKDGNTPQYLGSEPFSACESTFNFDPYIHSRIPCDQGWRKPFKWTSDSWIWGQSHRTVRCRSYEPMIERTSVKIKRGSRHRLSDLLLSQSHLTPTPMATPTMSFTKVQDIVHSCTNLVFKFYLLDLMSWARNLQVFALLLNHS